jgi:hypothetical protein
MDERERTSTDPTGPLPPSRGRPTGARSLAGREVVLTVAFATAALAVPLALLAHITALSGFLPTVLGLWALGFPLSVYFSRLQNPVRLGWVLASTGLGLALFSFGTGRFNGLTDEPYMMPQFVGTLLHGHDPYSTAITVTYHQYGTAYTDTAVYSYLPLLLVLQPFVVSYRLYTIAAWAVTTYLVRRRPLAFIAIGQPYLALLAASGFNDFPVLLLLTLGFVGIGGRRQYWAEVLSLGTKQFANVVVVGYYLVKREVGRALLALGISVAFVVPFLLWNPGAFVCRAVLLWPPVCGSSAGPPLSHFNYWVWPVWVVGLYFEPIRGWGRRRLRTLGWERRAPAPIESPAPTV